MNGIGVTAIDIPMPGAGFFGASAITDINDIIPKSLKLNHGKIKRLGMPVEPGNLMLLGNIKTNNKNILFIKW